MSGPEGVWRVGVGQSSREETAKVYGEDQPERWAMGIWGVRCGVSRARVRYREAGDRGSLLRRALVACWGGCGACGRCAVHGTRTRAFAPAQANEVRAVS